MSEHTGTVLSVNVGPGGIPKHAVESISVSTDGLAGDGHDHDKHNTPLQAVCLFDVEDLDALKNEGYALYPGAIGENVTVRGMDVDALSIGDRLRFSGGLEIEITKARTPCFVLDAIDPTLKKALVGRCGCYGKVLSPAELRPGETIEVQGGA
ncbi:MAG: MOSC domain-containing protein [Planctomycetota bacterium]